MREGVGDSREERGEGEGRERLRQAGDAEEAEGGVADGAPRGLPLHTVTFRQVMARPEACRCIPLHIPLQIPPRPQSAQEVRGERWRVNRGPERRFNVTVCNGM